MAAHEVAEVHETAISRDREGGVVGVQVSPDKVSTSAW